VKWWYSGGVKAARGYVACLRYSPGDDVIVAVAAQQKAYRHRQQRLAKSIGSGSLPQGLWFSTLRRRREIS